MQKSTLKTEKVLGLIPARGGSEGIKGKNIVPLCGKPLIGWVCEEARKAAIFDELIVSSDDSAIIEAANSYGVSSSYVRPEKLAQDDTLVIEVILHAVEWYREHQNVNFDYVALLQPTAPLAIADDYIRAVECAKEKAADTVVTLYQAAQHHPAIMYTIDEEGKADFFANSLGWNKMARRQDLPPVYMRSGIVYVFKTSTLEQSLNLYGGVTYSIEVPEERGAIDINTPFDLVLAEAAINYFGYGNK